MNQTDSKPLQESNDGAQTSASLVTRAGQIMAIIIALGLVSMISSMLVSESLSGDAAQINHAGALRMQAMRISRAHLLTSVNHKSLIDAEIAVFEDKLTHLFSGGLTSARENPHIESQFQIILAMWQQLKQTERPVPINSFDQFVAAIDQLVTLLQEESEKKLSVLRLIQGISLLSVLIVAFVVLIRLNRLIVAPLKQLVYVAAEVGKGNFQHRADYDSDDELGVLAKTINQMSSELESTYLDLEDRVAKQTQELLHSNRSLEVLYRAARNLATKERLQSDRQIVIELEKVLGYGKVIIERDNTVVDTNTLASDSIDIKIADPSQPNFCENLIQFPLQEKNKIYGFVKWQLPKNRLAEDWQIQILRAMADVIATAIGLEYTRITENRLLIVEERAVIARELHDSLAQSLSYLKVQMSLLTRKFQKDLPKEQLFETIEDIKSGLNKAYQQLRELLTTFRLKLDDPSISNALQGTVSEFSAKCQHPVELDFRLPQNYLSANQEIHVLQIVREALSNVHRHAKAQRAGVTVRKKDSNVFVEIWDNGKGMPALLEQHGHFGLGIMEERAKSLNALIDIEQNSPAGTRIIIEFER